MKIAFVSSEVVPFAKTGGLADVAGALPKALEKLGCEIKIFMPKYYSIDETKFGLHYNWDIGEMPIRVNGQIRSVHLHQAKLPKNGNPNEKSDIEVNFIDCPHYFHRGHFYTNDEDEDERFILFCKGVIEALQRLNWIPDIIHCNDWQTGLLPLYIKDNYSWDEKFSKTATLYTIHNIAYQGRFSHQTMFKGELSGDLFYSGGPVEFENSVCFMKAGLSFSDLINTVSKTYADEILTQEYGAGLDGTLRQRKDDLYGIINGIDTNTWNPESDPLIPNHYSSKDLSGKLKNKKYLLEHLNLAFDEEVPVIGIISRMVSQKGFDIFAEAVNDLMQLKAQWIILGNGEEVYENFFRSLAAALPYKVVSYIGFNNELSHLIEAGADIFVMPSRYEPCGLNQIYSLRYGTVPVVRKTGGLADSVQDWHEYQSYGLDTGSGFSFNDYSSYALYTSVKRAVDMFADKKTWNKIQKNGMDKDYSWENSAEQYLTLYRKAIQKRR
jgi:starch synthase